MPFMPSHALPDLLKPSLRVVFCGTAAGEDSAAASAYYAGLGNQFWPTLYTVGLTPHLVAPAAFRDLHQYGIGLTDIAKYRAGTDDNLHADDFDLQGFRQ